MARKPRVTVALVSEVLEKLDESRGMIPRSTLINDALIEFLDIDVVATAKEIEADS